MFSHSLKSVVVGVFALAIVGIAAFFLAGKDPSTPLPEQQPATPSVPLAATSTHKVIGHSVEGRAIDAYTYGHGKTKLLFVGGMHGGYEWNSVLLAYAFMDYLDNDPSVIPKNLSVVVIPSLNPDGVYKVIGKEGRFSLADVPSNEVDASAGRFNAHKVDLNRNFDCNWQPESTWRNNKVSAGTSAFSEPESTALENYVFSNEPALAVFWHSQANAVYASECNKGILPDTLKIMNAYAGAAGYPAVRSFDSYAVTGDSEGWLASINIPAITVELKTHDTIEWDRNLLGIKALFELYK